MSTTYKRSPGWFPFQFLILSAILLHLSSGPCSGMIPTDVPTLDDISGEWLPLTTVANPPAVHNFHDMLQINRDLTSFNFYPGDTLWQKGHTRAGYPLIKLTVDGKEYAAADCRWFAYCALRRNLNCGGMAIETDTRLINEQRAVLVRLRVSNPKVALAKNDLTLSVDGTLSQDGITVTNTTQRPGFLTMVRPVQKPTEVTVANGVVSWHWHVSLAAGGQQLIEFVSADGAAADVANIEANLQKWCGNFVGQFDGFKHDWEQRWIDAFTPGKKHFSGSLPILATDNPSLKRNYYMGIVTMLILERTQFPMSSRSFITSGERSPGTQYFWDASMQTTVWALLEPAGMKATLRRWLVQNVRSGVVINLKSTKGYDKTVHPEITGYAFTACNMFKTAWDYLRITGDTAFLKEKLENGETVLQRLDEIATDWKALVLSDSPLPNYGENKNLLECAPAYIHRVASASAQDVWMMRQAAELEEFSGNTEHANELRGEADKLLPAVLSLYEPGEGVWYGLHKDGNRVELRHCVDFIYVGNALTNELTSAMRREMIQFVKSELFQTNWMRAMSLKDKAAAASDRPDHGPMGAYDGWIPLTVGTMWRLGDQKAAFDFYCQTAEVTKEGPFAQAREFYGENRKMSDAPVRIAARGGCMKECISGVAFSDVVINTFFGFDPSLDGKTLFADHEIPRPFAGKLVNLSFRGKLLTVVADTQGVHLQ